MNTWCRISEHKRPLHCSWSIGLYLYASVDSDRAFRPDAFMRCRLTTPGTGMGTAQWQWQLTNSIRAARRLLLGRQDVNMPWTEPRRVPDVGLRFPGEGFRRVEMPGFARERTPFRGALVFSVPPGPRGRISHFSADELRMRLGENGTVAAGSPFFPSLCAGCYRIGVGGASCVSSDGPAPAWMERAFSFGEGGLGMIGRHGRAFAARSIRSKS